MARGVIVTCAITGSLYTPSISPHLPITPAQIESESIAATEAVVAILTLMLEIPKAVDPLSIQTCFLRPVCRWTSGSRRPRRRAPEMTLLNMNSINVGLFPAIAPIQ